MRLRSPCMKCVQRSQCHKQFYCSARVDADAPLHVEARYGVAHDEQLPLARAALLALAVVLTPACLLDANTSNTCNGPNTAAVVSERPSN